MTAAARPGGCWPTPEQTLLLQAALLEGDVADRALERWCSDTTFETLDRVSTRLLPLLYTRLRKACPSHPLLPRLQAPYNRTTSRNQALMTTAGAAVRVLRGAGIDTMLLKGMALIANGLTPLGARPMADCDLLVPEDRALDARDALVGAGWTLEQRLDAGLLHLRHSAPLRDPHGRRVDLHWHVLAACCTPGSDVDFWRAAVPAQLDGVATHTLCATDIVLHACVHGLEWSIIPPIRWVADAMTAIQSSAVSIDWNRLVSQATHRTLVLPVRDALRFLSDTFAAPVPASALRQLSLAPVPRWAIHEHRIKMRRRSRARQVLFHWFHHRRLSNSGSVLKDLVRVPSYVARRWGSSPDGPRTPARCTAGFRFGPVVVDVDGGSTAITEWLREFLSPAIGATTAGAGALQIRLTPSHGLYEMPAAGPSRTARSVPCFSLDRRLIALPGWQDGETLVVADAHHRCVYGIRGRTIGVVGDPDDRLVRIALMRVVREALTAFRRARGSLLDLHAAAFETAGRALLIAGPRHSGKTTLLCYALISGRSRLIANDRVLVEAGDGPPEALGVPTLTSIRPDTIRFFPQLDSLTEPGLSPSRLAAGLGASSVASAPLAGIVFPEFTDTVESWSLEELSDAEGMDRLDGCIYGGSRDAAVPTIFEELAGYSTSHTKPRALADRLSGRVRFLRCRLGSGAYHRPACEWMDALSRAVGEAPSID